MLAVIKEQIIGILQQLNAMAIDHGLNPITFILAKKAYMIVQQMNIVFPMFQQAFQFILNGINQVQVIITFHPFLNQIKQCIHSSIHNFCETLFYIGLLSEPFSFTQILEKGGVLV